VIFVPTRKVRTTNFFPLSFVADFGSGIRDGQKQDPGSATLLSRSPLKFFNHKKLHKILALQLQYLLLLGQGIFIVWSLLLSAGYFYIYSTMKKVIWCDLFGL
jgi:hypothetical protein